MKQWIVIAGLMLLPATAMASDMEAGMSTSMDSMQMQQDTKMFLKKVEVDGYMVSFHVMKAAEGMQHGGSHNMMVKVEKNGELVEIVRANSKVITSDGKAETKKMMNMGEWQMASYDLGQGGQQQLMVLFKTTDDQKHFAGVWYPGKDSE